MKDEIKEILDLKIDCDYKRLSVDEIVILKDYITNLQEELEKTRLENKVLKEQMVAMVQPNYIYGISGGSSE